MTIVTFIIFLIIIIIDNCPDFKINIFWILTSNPAIWLKQNLCLFFLSSKKMSSGPMCCVTTFALVGIIGWGSHSQFYFLLTNKSRGPEMPSFGEKQDSVVVQMWREMESEERLCPLELNSQEIARPSSLSWLWCFCSRERAGLNLNRTTIKIILEGHNFQCLHW